MSRVLLVNFQGYPVPSWRVLGTLCAIIYLAAGSLRAEDFLNPEVEGFIQTYCIDCHGAEKQKGDRAFHEMADLPAEEKDILLEDILDQLNLGEMPPKKKDVKQPADSEIANTIKWLTETLLAKEKGARHNHTVLRRLNRREYKNTMEDHFGLHDLTFDPTEGFPKDDVDEGFTNIGEALSLSESHLDQYLNAAEMYIERGIHFGHPYETKKMSISPDEWGAPARQAVTPWSYRLYKPGEYLDIGSGEKDLSRKVYQITYPQEFLQKKGIPVSGYYRIRVNATAVRRLTHGYDPAMIPADLEAPMQLGVYVATAADGVTAAGVKSRMRVGLWDVKDHQPENYDLTVWLDKGSIPFVNWDNGPGPSDYWMRDICKKYHTDIEFRGKEGAHAWHIVGKDLVPGRIISDVWRGPRLRIREFSFTGPLPETWRSDGKKRYFEGKTGVANIDLESAFRKFTRAAFRRPVSRADFAPYLNLYHKTVASGRPPKQALILALKSVLVSPDFLYLKEIGNDDGTLTSHELANRLSYSLWSSMPDETLFQLAESGRISSPDVLEKQVRRMIASIKTDALVNGLCESWLRYDKLGSMPPDSSRFYEYYLYDYESLFREETRRFVKYILRNNRPISDFLKSDYTFLNQDLARHYKIDGVEGIGFRKVALTPDHRRGGLLGQAGILTLTANGVDTTPVTRGVWVLENILGTPPAPPPPDVEPLDSDTRGAQSIRQRLEKHRTVESCADCHNQIDPYGFPFEFYDAVGGFRETYFRGRRWNRLERKTRFFPGQKVNGWAKLESGEPVHNLLDLQNVLLTKEIQFKRALVEKLLVYVSGRKMTFRDHEEIESIVNSDVNGFQDLVLAVVKSSIFNHR